MATLGDFLTSINKSKRDIMEEDSLAEREYIPFLVCRTLSYFPDTVFNANEVNIRSTIDHKMHYDYLRTSIRAKSRFSRWDKLVKNETIELIKLAYQCNTQRANEVVSMFSEEEIEKLRKRVQTGGKK